MVLLPNDSQSPGSASEGEVPLKGMGRGGARAARTNQLRRILALSTATEHAL